MILKRIEEDFSMPLEWIHLLQAFEGNKAELLWNLKHKYTVSDVYDMLEYIDVETTYAAERQRIEKQNNKV